GLVGLLGRRGQALRRVIDDAETAAEIEAVDRAVAHLEAHLAVRRLDVLDHGLAAPGKIEIEIARAAEVRVAGERRDQRLEIERRRAPGEAQAGLARRVDVQRAVELAAVKPRLRRPDARAPVADRKRGRDLRELEPR